MTDSPTAASALTDPAHERWVSGVLGLPPDVADRLVARLVAEERLADGVATLVLLHAARRGSEAAVAAEELASGARALPRAPSDYELRTTRDELHDLLDERPAASAASVPVAGADGAVARSAVHLDVVRR